MGAVSDLSDLVSKLTGGSDGNPHAPMVWIDARIGSAAAGTTVAGRWKSLWQNNKSAGGAGAVPGAVSAPTKSTTGALPFNDASGGRVRRLAGFNCSGSQSGTLLLYDRLLHVSGLDATITTLQTLGGTLTRNTGGVGNQIWLEIYTQIGATLRNIIVNYTDQGGNASVTPSVAAGGAGLREAQCMIPMTLADGDTGVRGVTNLDIDASIGTAGDFGVTVIRPIAQVFVPQGGFGQAADLLTDFPLLPALDDNSCLALAFLAVGSATPAFMVHPSMIEA